MSLVAENKNEYNIFSGISLKQEQIEGIDYALSRQNCILNLAPGCGKTVVSLAFAHRIMKSNKDALTIIVCPKAATTAFKKELARTSMHYSIYTTEETYYDDKSRIFLFNYTNLDKMEQVLVKLRDLNFRIIGIFDEAHVVGSADSNQAQRLRKLRPMFNCCVGLTGTPLLNDVQGLFYTVDFCKPGFLGNWWQFRETYVDYHYEDIRVSGGRKRRTVVIDGYKDIDALRLKLQDVILTRFREYNIEFNFRQCVLTPDEFEHYKTAAAGLVDSLDEKQFSSRLYDLQRVADGSLEQMDKGVLYSKNQLLVNVVRECVNRNEAVLIYTELEDTYTKLQEVIKDYKGYIGYDRLWMITGKTKYSDRVNCEKKLHEKDVVIVTKAGNKSINLQASNNVIFYDIPFAVGDYVQMCGRITRTDSKYDVQNIYILEAKDTIDSYKKLLLLDHMELIKQLFGNTSVMPVYDTKIDVQKYRKYLKQKLLWLRC